MGFNQLSRLLHGLGSYEIHDENARGRSGKLSDGSPHHLRIVQMVEQTVADDRVVAGARQSEIRQQSFEQLHALLNVDSLSQREPAIVEHRFRTVHTVN